VSSCSVAPMPSPSGRRRHTVFVELLRAVYDMGDEVLGNTDPESDVVCLALSNTLDELASLISVYDNLEEAAQ